MNLETSIKDTITKKLEDGTMKVTLPKQLNKGLESRNNLQQI